MKNRLFDLRAERKLSQEDLATQLKYSQQKISRYESGNSVKVDATLEEKLCDYFGCTLDYLRCRSSIRNEQKYSDTLVKVKDLIEAFYDDGDTENKQDLTEKELASFLEFISQFKDLLKKFPK